MQADLKTRFTDLALREKQIVLAELISNLTLASRAEYDASEPQRFHHMRGLNESIHTASDQLAALLAKDLRRYPDNVFLEILFERAGIELERELTHALDSALKSHTLTS